MTKWRLALVAGVLGFVVAYMQYNKPHKDYGAEPIERSWEADELVTWFKETPAEGHGTWHDKVVRVDGVVASVSKRGIVVAPGVVVHWSEDESPEAEKGAEVAVVGRIVGFDGLFGEVRLDHARRAD
jgi:hypothetical protein